MTNPSGSPHHEQNKSLGAEEIRARIDDAFKDKNIRRMRVGFADLERDIDRNLVALDNLASEGKITDSQLARRADLERAKREVSDKRYTLEMRDKDMMAAANRSVRDRVLFAPRRLDAGEITEPERPTSTTTETLR